MADTGTDAFDTDGTLGDEQLLRLLASDTRRATVQALQSESPASLSDLATVIADDDATALERPERIRQRLHHCHLPALETAGVLRYDADDCHIDYLGNETIESLLSALDE